MLERTACTGRRSAAYESSTPRRPVQAAVQRQRYVARRELDIPNKL
jgi:hypothetical protein